MAIVAATIADGGRRPRPTFLAGAQPAPSLPVMTAGVDRTVRQLMIEVVRSGTGTAAAIPGTVVAGKTGTAELKSECTSSRAQAGGGEPPAREGGPEGCQGTASEASNTDAWFAAFAPALHPRIVVAVLLVKDGAGGSTAAPVAREVLEAGLTRSR
jgi:cell division protein FtsI/penicillin-binding protein 2